MNIFRTITLSDEYKCDIDTINGGHISFAMAKHQRNKELDLIIFIIAEVCEIEGKKESVEVYKIMEAGDYMQIIEVVSLQLNQFSI